VGGGNSQAGALSDCWKWEGFYNYLLIDLFALNQVYMLLSIKMELSAVHARSCHAPGTPLAMQTVLLHDFTADHAHTMTSFQANWHLASTTNCSTTRLMVSGRVADSWPSQRSSDWIQLSRNKVLYQIFSHRGLTVRSAKLLHTCQSPKMDQDL